MIEAYVREENDFSLFRFMGTISIGEIKDSVVNAMDRNKNSPYEPVALIDTRSAEKYDARFSHVLGFAEWLKYLFMNSGQDSRVVILTSEPWKYGMAHMFAMAADYMGNINVKICNTEDELLQHCNIKLQSISDLFKPEHLIYTCEVPPRSA